MSWRFIKFSCGTLLLATFLVQCVQSDYTKLVKSELAKGVRKDSVLLGIRFGITRNDFYARCLELNQKHLTTQGIGFYVQYFILDSLVHPKPTQIQLLFSPGFDEKGVLTDMDLKFSYPGWSPWNKSLHSDSLKIKVMKLMEHWYGGNKFITAHVDDHEVPVKLDGNRRLLVYIENPQIVVVSIQDILHPKYQHNIK